MPFSHIWGPFLKVLKRFSHPENCGKISNLMITELSYSFIPNMTRGFLKFIQDVSGIHRRTKNGFTGPKVSSAFEKWAPGPQGR